MSIPVSTRRDQQAMIRHCPHERARYLAKMRQYNAARRERAKRLKLCPVCGDPAMDGYTRCRECREIDRANRQRQREDAKAGVVRVKPPMTIIRFVKPPTVRYGRTRAQSRELRERAQAMRARGVPVKEIGRALGHGVKWVYQVAPLSSIDGTHKPC